MVGNIPVWGEHEEKTLVQMKTCAATADRAALMADGHLGYAVPIGWVVAYKDTISPLGVCFDIACGNKAVRVDMPGEELRAKVSTIMDDVWSTLSLGVGRKNSEKVEHPIFDRDHAGWDLESTRPLKQKAQGQLGRLVRGIITSTCSRMSLIGCGSACILGLADSGTVLRPGS
jgi:tRNA-splicing ligase RtcB